MGKRGRALMLSMMEIIRIGKLNYVTCIVCNHSISTYHKRFNEIVLEAQLHVNYNCPERKPGKAE